VDGQPTPDLDRFLAAVKFKKHRDAVRLRMIDLEGRERARTMKLDLQYWPTSEVLRTPQGWARQPRGADGAEEARGADGAEEARGAE
jgi:hypothetical protein